MSVTVGCGIVWVVQLNGDDPVLRRTRGSAKVPIGLPLPSLMTSEVRAWTNYNLGLGRAGSLNFGLLASFDSGRTFSLADNNVPLTPIQRQNLIAAGYVDLLPASANDIYSPSAAA